ncbi:MAG: PilZ domain-containing protein [Phycisphaerae bacterium]|nr:PilZ domain-containing protein [Phycisphaerae bacterium]
MRHAIKLDQDATAQALESAVRQQVPVILESPEFRGATINGFVIAGDSQAILMKVTGRPAIDLRRVIDTHCDGQIYGERRFMFRTRITSSPRWGETQTLAFERPCELVVMERRRFFRASLAPSSKVSLSWTRNGRTHQYQAALLNISADGIACRVEDAVAMNVDRHERLMTSFELPGIDRIELPATVSNMMPGSEGCTLLGLQFVCSEKDARKIANLRRALGADGIGTAEFIAKA